MRRKLSLASVLLILFLTIQFTLLAPEELEVRSPSEFLKVEDWNNEVQQNIQGVRLIESQNGRKEWQIAAQDATASRDNKSWLLNTVQARFYSQEETYYDIQCGQAEFYSKSKELEFSKEVELKSSNSYLFYTESLKYLPNTRSLTGNQGVEFFAFPEKTGKKKGVLKILSNEVAVSLASNQIQLTGEVYSEETYLGKQRFQLQSESIVFDQNGKTAFLEREISLRYGDMLLKSPKAVLSYGENTDNLSSIVMTGGVQVEGQNRKATAERLELDLNTETLILKGDPRLLQKGDELLGEEIIFRRAGKDIEVRRAKAHLNSSGSRVLDE